MNGERVTVTGATGFIGRALVRRLMAEGAEVTALVREKDGRGRAAHLPEGVCIAEADLRYAGGVARAVRASEPSLVIHLAAAGVTDPFLPVNEAIRGNLDTTLNVLTAVAGRCRVIVARTPGEAEAINVYAAAKAAAWAFCRMFHRTEGWPIVAVMPFQTYGPGQPLRTVLGAALKAARAGETFPMTSGEQERDWVYIDDVVNGIIAAARAPKVEGETIELGTGVGTAVGEVVGRLFQLVGRGRPLAGALPQRPREVSRQIADAARAEKLTGWRAAVNLDEGLKRICGHE